MTKKPYSTIQIFMTFFQDDILREVGPEAFELGLLIAIETDPHEEEAHVFTFRHLLLLEFVVAKYVTSLTMVYISIIVYFAHEFCNIRSTGQISIHVIRPFCCLSNRIVTIK